MLRVNQTPGISDERYLPNNLMNLQHNGLLGTRAKKKLAKKSKGISSVTKTIKP